MRATYTTLTPRNQRKEEAMQAHVKAPQETSKSGVELTAVDPVAVNLAVVDPVAGDPAVVDLAVVDLAVVDLAVVEASVAGQIEEGHNPVARDRDAIDEECCLFTFN